MWKLSTNHSAAGVIARSSRMALAIARYASRSTRPLSSTRGNSRRPFSNSLMTGWAAARLSACCSRRSTPKSSARIGSSNSCGANSAEGWALGIAVSEAKESGELLARTRDCSGSAKARQPLPRREIEYTGTRSLEEPCLALKPARRSELLDQLRRLRASDDVARAHPVDIAEALNLLDPRVAGRALSSLPFDLAVRVLEQPEFDRRATPPISKPRIAPRRWPFPVRSLCIWRATSPTPLSPRSAGPSRG